MATPKIVILGAGYGGLVTAVTLQKQLNYNEADVILVNKHNYHYITTGLHEPAAGTRNADKVKIDINSIIDSRKITLKHATVLSINSESKSVLLEDGEELSYDHLVIGL
ncbi:MAG: FAD-dependent oxidoreductase, partial [Bacilli bacterium]